MAKTSRILLILTMVVGLLWSSNLVYAHGEQAVTTFFTLIGGDGDAVSHNNNLFKQKSNGEKLGDFCTLKFVYSVSGDYTNETAKNRADVAKKAISENLGLYDKYAIAAFSHGGQSLFFMTDTPCTEIFLLEATTRIPGICNDPESIGENWSKKIVEFASQGRNVHIYASGDNENISKGSRRTIEYIESYAQSGSVIDGFFVQKVCEGEYVVCDSTYGEICGNIFTQVVGGRHGNTCIAAAPDIIATIKR